MDDIERFCEITGSSEEVAVAKLSENNYSLRSALNSFMANSSSPSPRDSASGESGIAVPPASANSGSTSSLLSETDNSTASRLFTRTNSSVSRRNISTSSSLSGSTSGAIQFPSSRNNVARGGLISRISESSSFSSRRERLLDSIFKPPYDIIFPGDFFSAKDYARDSDLWLLVDIQSPQNFDCQCLNRDIWNNAKIKKLIRKHFLFIQYSVDTSEGRRYTQFYPASHFPYVAILDPRTGELLQTCQKLTVDGALKQFTDFINERGSPSISDDVCGDKAPGSLDSSLSMDVVNEASTSKEATDGTNTFMSIQPVLNEEEALKAAIKASLQYNNKSESSSSSSSTRDGFANMANSHHNPVILSDDDDFEMEDCFEVTRSINKGGNNEEKWEGENDEDEDDNSSTASSILSDDDNDFGYKKRAVFYGSKTNVNRKRKMKSVAVSKGGKNSHLSGTLKRLKLDKLAQQRQSKAANNSSSSSTSHPRDVSPSEQQGQSCNSSKLNTRTTLMSSSSTLEVQNIGPLMPPPDCSSFPTEVSLLKDSSLPSLQSGPAINRSSNGSNSSSAVLSSCSNSQDEKNGVKILLKCPNGERRTINIASSSTLKLFFMGCGSLGYSDMLYEFSTHFPKRILNTLDRKTTLSDLGITQNCIIFVESKF